MQYAFVSIVVTCNVMALSTASQIGNKKLNLVDLSSLCGLEEFASSLVTGNYSFTSVIVLL